MVVACKIPIMEMTADNGSIDFTVDEKDMPATDSAISELFEGIDIIYFSNDGFFKPISNELEKLSVASLEIDELERERFKLKRQMQVVSKKITAFIIKNSLEFNKNVENYETIRNDAKTIFLIIRRLRKAIEITRHKCKMTSTVLAAELKREISNRLHSELTIIKSFHKSEIKMKELIQGNNNNPFPFFLFGVEILTAMKSYIKYTTVKQLYAGLLNFLSSEESKLNLLLASQVSFFVPERYTIIYEVYNLTENLEKMPIKLQELFNIAFNNFAHSAIVGLIKNCPENLPKDFDEELSFEALLILIEQKYIIRALLEIGTGLVELLSNYHSFLRFHIEDDKKRANCRHESNCIESNSRQEQDISAESFETTLIVERGVMQKSLLEHLHPIFKSAANIYCSLLSHLDLSHLKFDHFLKIIEISEKFREFGYRHFGNSHLEIAVTVMKKSRAFFRQYHSERMDELKMFLENETFTLCPVPMQFSLFDLPEFHYLKGVNAFEEVEENAHFMEMRFEIDLDTCDKKLNFTLLEIEATANDVFPQWEQIEDSSPSHSLKYQNSVSTTGSLAEDEETDTHIDPQFPPVKSMPNLCNTALNVLRIIGRYVKMSKILQCTVEQTIDAIFQLYNYFIYTLYKYFCMDFSPQQQQMAFGINFCSLRLRQLMESIQKNYSNEQTTIASDSEAQEFKEESIDQLMLPKICLPLDDIGTLFSLSERIIGTESGILLSKQLELLRPVLETLLPPKMREQKLEPFYKTLPIASDLLEAAIGCVAAKALPYKSILKQIQQVDWNIGGEIPSQHSAYVDFIIKEFHEFNAKYCQLHSYVHISRELNQICWSMLSSCTMRTFVQGYSEAKKCTGEGRALQLMDIGHICNCLEELSGLKPLPHRSHVENYIKAFFLPSDELNQWIVHHTEYTLDQTSALLNASSPSITAKKTTAKMSRIMMNLLDASGIGEASNNPLFQ